MTKHTPGPWKMSGANTVHGPDCIVAFVGTSNEEVRKFSGERQNADAHLIAAAPDLLAACEQVMADMVQRRHKEWNLYLETAVSRAIAKARGQ